MGTIRRSLGVVAVSMLSACGGSSERDASSRGDSGSGAASSGAAGSSASGSVGSGAAATGGSASASTGGAAGSSACVPVDDPDPWSNADCDNLARLEVVDGWFEDWSGDGKVLPGEHVIVGATVRDTSGMGYFDYPGLVFETSDAGVEFVSEPRDFSVYAFLGCDSVDGRVQIAVGDVPSGSIVRILARAASLNRDCPGAPSRDIPIYVY